MRSTWFSGYRIPYHTGRCPTHTLAESAACPPAKVPPVPRPNFPPARRLNLPPASRPNRTLTPHSTPSPSPMLTGAVAWRRLPRLPLTRVQLTHRRPLVCHNLSKPCPCASSSSTPPPSSQRVAPSEMSYWGRSVRLAVSRARGATPSPRLDPRPRRANGPAERRRGKPLLER